MEDRTGQAEIKKIKRERFGFLACPGGLSAKHSVREQTAESGLMGGEFEGTAEYRV